MKALKYQDTENTGGKLEERVQQLTLLAHALASEIDTMDSEMSTNHRLHKEIALGHDGIDFYHEVECYEIELIQAALSHCHGNQTRAAKLLQMKSTTLHAKMKNYGLKITLRPLQSK